MTMWGVVIGRRVVLGWPDGTFVRRACAANYSNGISNVRQPPVPDVVRKPRRLPFLKSIYAGRYDVEVLTYPETLNLERHNDLERRVQQVRHNCSRVDTVRQLGLFGMNAPYPCSGLALSDTEMARVFEHFDRQTFTTVFGHTLAVDIVKTFGTPGQKSKYLPLFASGAVCSLHDNAARAASLPNQSWELTATVNNSADTAYLLFVVGNKAYVVEKHKAAVSGENVLLERVVVSPDDVLDNVDATKIMNTGKLYVCSLLVSSLKKVVQSTVASVLPKSRLNLKLREFDSVLKILGNALINIYTIESMVYLTTWMTDGFDDPDIELESAAVQLFVHQTVGTTLAELKMLYGRRSIQEEPFCTLCDDVEDLVESLEGRMKLANFISNRGIDYHGKYYHKENVSFITSMFRDIMMKKDEPSLKYGLKQFLHPALMYSADFLERCVLKFQFAIDQNHSSNQLDTGNQQLMQRFSTVIVHIYAMTAVIGRASRSYCTGIRFCDHEMQIGETRIRESSTLLAPILEELISGKYAAVDSLYESFARQSFDSIKNVQTKV